MPRKPTKTSILATLTVTALRAASKSLGLPAYKSGGQSLLKADLISQLEAAGWKGPAGKKAAAKKAPKQRGATKPKSKPVKKTTTKKPPAKKVAPKATKRKRVVVVGGNVIHVAKLAEPVSEAELAGFQTFELLSMARGLDRHCDPAMSKRALVSYLVGSEKSLEELKAGKREAAGGRGARNLSGSGWTDQGRALGVKAVLC